MLGANIYYDYRRLHHFDRNQIGLGLELLGSYIDFRFNAYIPIKNHHTSRGIFFDFSDDLFAVRKERVSVWTGFDAEVGMWLKRKYACDWFGLYFAIGPYYYHQNNEKYFDFSRHHKIWGGRVRFIARLWDFVDVSLIATHDPKWKTRMQGQITVVIPFDYFINSCRSNCSDCISFPCLQSQIASQPVWRNEIIAAESQCCWSWNWSDQGGNCQSSSCSGASSGPSSRSISLSRASRKFSSWH